MEEDKLVLMDVQWYQYVPLFSVGETIPIIVTIIMVLLFSHGTQMIVINAVLWFDSHIIYSHVLDQRLRKCVIILLLFL